MAEKINSLSDTNEIRLSQLAATQQHFIRKWKPEEIHDIAEFERELFYLLYLAQQIAVAPILARMASVIAAVPDPVILELYPETRK